MRGSRGEGATMQRIPMILSLLALVLLGAAHPARADGEWLNIRLNQDTTAQLQNEEQVAINPLDPDNMVAVWRDFRLGYRQVAWGYTFDGGQSWTDAGLFVEPHYPWQSDPGVTTDAAGNFYAIVLSYTSTSEPNGFYVYKSTNGGVSWGPPLEVINGAPGVFEDKEFIACDRTASAYRGNLYVVWARFYDTQILLRRSTNAGQSWSSNVTVSDQGGVQFPIPVVGRNGELFVAWTSYGSSAILVDVSTTGGLAFGTDRTVATVYTPSTMLNGNIDAYSSPAMDADITAGAYGGRLYVAFMDRRNGYGDYDIWVTHSNSAGVTWSTPVRANDDPVNNGRDQFHPWLVVDNQGIVSVVFLDRRHDPQNRTYHCYVTQSFDGGATWEPNVQVSTVASDPNYAFADAPPLDAGAFAGAAALREGPQPSVSPTRAGLLGEYIGLTAHSGRMTPIWTDIRNHHQDAFAGYLLGGSGAGAPGAPPRLALRFANPVRAGEGVSLTLDARGAGSGALQILDPTGRLVRAIELPAGAAGRVAGTTLRWDGRDASGESVPAGVYLLRLSASQAPRAKLVVIE
jgi:hypothetical protein